MLWGNFHSYIKKMIIILSGLACSTPLYALTPSNNADHLVSGIMSYTDWGQDFEQLNFCVIDGPAKFISNQIFNPASPLIRPNTIKLFHFKVSDLIDKSSRINNMPCQVLYFVNTEDSLQQKLLINTTGKFLTISENNPDCSIGSSFCLYQQNQNFNFKVNLNGLKKSKLRVNSKVLMLSQSGGNL